MPEGWNLADTVYEAMYPSADEYADDPVGFIRDKLNEFIWSKQVEICEALRTNRYVTVRACHGPGKSFIASRIALWWNSSFPLGDAFVVTTAPSWDQIQAILWREMRRAHRKAKLRGRMTLDCKWHMGENATDEELIAMGRKPQDYDEQAFQGIHARRVLVIIDEACGVPKALFDAVESLVTNENCRVLAIGNPDDPTSFFADTHKPDSGWHSIKISAFETPNFTGEFVPDEVAEQLTSPIWVQEREKRWGRGSPLWTSKVEAEFPDVSDNTLIQPKWIEAAKARDLSGLEVGQFGADIARYGPDETCVYRNRGGHVRLVYSRHKQDTAKTTDDFAAILNSQGVLRVPMAVDVIGVGAGVYDQLRDRQLPVAAFHGGLRAFNDVRFINKRAEAFWLLRTMFEEGLIDIDPADEELQGQLLSIRYWIDGRGKIHIESKEDMADRGVASPDRADAVMMSVQPGLRVHGFGHITGSSLTADLLEREM